MRNPIHKRMERFEPWQHLTFMACLCERMYPNFQIFCHVAEQEENVKIYQNILNLVWEHLTVKGAKINFDNQLEKLENIIPDVNEYEFLACFQLKKRAKPFLNCYIASLQAQHLNKRFALVKFLLAPLQAI